VNEQQYADVEVWVCVDSCGDYAVGRDRDDAAEDYEADIGEASAAEGLRYVRVTLKVALPAAVELTGTAPALGTAELTRVS
jgi:hypothetical protein